MHHFISNDADYVALLFLVVVWYGFRLGGGGYDTPSARQDRPAFYQILARVAPAPWVFGLAWFLLYGLMAVAQYLSYRSLSDDHVGRTAVAWSTGLFLLTLLLNKAWSPAFFKMQNPGTALVMVIAGLVVALALDVVLFVSGQTWSAVLVIPYIIWLAFAVYFNVRFLNAWNAHHKLMGRATGSDDDAQYSTNWTKKMADKADVVSEGGGKMNFNV